MVHILGCRVGLHYDRVLRRSAVRGGDSAGLGFGAESEGAESAGLGPMMKPWQCKGYYPFLQISYEARRRLRCLRERTADSLFGHTNFNPENLARWTLGT